MTKEELLQSIQAIGTCEDDVERRALLTDFKDAIVNDYDNFCETMNKVTQLESDNEHLRSANMKLFLKVGGQSESQQQTKNESLKFSDLFNEKGELK